MKVALFAILVVVVLLLSGCTTSGYRYESPTTSQNGLPNSIQYFHDTTRKVGIWIYKDSGGIYVLPDSEYKVTGN